MQRRRSAAVNERRQRARSVHERRESPLKDRSLPPRRAAGCFARAGVQWLVAMFACVLAAIACTLSRTTVCPRASDASRTCRERFTTRPTTKRANGRGSASTIRSRRATTCGSTATALAEVDYGGGQFRLAGDTNLHVSRLDERQLALFIASGSVIVRVRVLEPDDSVRVDTPATQVALDAAGALPDRRRARTAARRRVIVREGEAEVATPAATQQVLPGPDGRIDRRRRTSSADIRNGGGIDGFDAWSAARDRVYEAAARERVRLARRWSARPTSTPMARWQTYPDYGAVWFPTVEPEWAPYRFGHWTWLSRLGLHVGRQCTVGLCAVPLRALGVHRRALGLVPGRFRCAAASGRRRSSHGTAAPAGTIPRPTARRSTAGCRSAGASRSCPGGAVARRAARRATTGPTRVNAARRRRDDPAHYANWTCPAAVTAVPAATLATGRPVAVNRVPIATNRPIAPPLLDAATRGAAGSGSLGCRAPGQRCSAARGQCRACGRSARVARRLRAHDAARACASAHRFASTTAEARSARVARRAIDARPAPALRPSRLPAPPLRPSPLRRALVPSRRRLLLRQSVLRPRRHCRRSRPSRVRSGPCRCRRRPRSLRPSAHRRRRCHCRKCACRRRLRQPCRGSLPPPAGLRCTGAASRRARAGACTGRRASARGSRAGSRARCAGSAEATR